MLPPPPSQIIGGGGLPPPPLFLRLCSQELDQPVQSYQGLLSTCEHIWNRYIVTKWKVKKVHISWSEYPLLANCAVRHFTLFS